MNHPHAKDPGNVPLWRCDKAGECDKDCKHRSPHVKHLRRQVQELEARIEPLELTVKVLESDKQTRNDALDHERKRIAAKDAALRVLESLGERLTDFDPPGPVTDEQRREDQYGRKIQNVAREALKK